MAENLLPPVSSLDTLFAGGKPSAPAPAAAAPARAVSPKWAPYLQIAAERGQKYGLPPGFLEAVLVDGEHWGREPNPRGVSPVGARGIAQFMPATAQQYGVNPDEPVSSIDGAARYLRDLLGMFGGDTQLAAAAYNAGQGNVRKHRGVPPFRETQAYVQRIAASPFLQTSAAAPQAMPAPAAPQAPQGPQALQTPQGMQVVDRTTYEGGPDIIRVQMPRQGAMAIPEGGRMLPPVHGFNLAPMAQASAQPEQPSFAEDMGNELMLGFASLGRAGTYIANQIFGGTVTQALDDAAANAQQYWSGRLSQQQQASDQAEFISSQPGEILGEAWGDPRAYAGLIARNLPSLLPGLAAAKGASIYGQVAGSAAAKAAIARGATAEAAAEAGKQAAVRAATRMGFAAGAITEGTIGGGQTGADTYDAIMRMPEQTLQQSAIYQSLRQSMDPQAARRELARNQGLQAMLVAGVADAVLGGLGDAALARLFLGNNVGRLKVAGRTALTEAGTEAAQSAGEQLSQNMAIQGADPSQQTWAGVANAAVAGAIGGGAVGGGFGFVAAPGQRADLLETEKKEPPALPALTGAPLPKLPGAVPGVPTYQFGNNTPTAPSPSSPYPRQFALPAPVMTVNPQGEASYGPMGPSSPVGGGPMMGNTEGEVGPYGQVERVAPYSPVGPSSPWAPPRRVPVQGGQGPVAVPLQRWNMLTGGENLTPEEQAEYDQAYGEYLQSTGEASPINRPLDVPGMRDLRAGLRGGMGFSWGDVDAQQAQERARQEEEAYRQRELQLADAPAVGEPGEPTYTKGELLRSLQSVTRQMGKEDPVTKQGGVRRQWVGKILDAANPAAAIRETYNEGTHPQAQLLDAWHQALTGSPIEGPVQTAGTAPTAGAVTPTAPTPVPAGPATPPGQTQPAVGTKRRGTSPASAPTVSPGTAPVTPTEAPPPAAQPASKQATGTSSRRKKSKALEEIPVETKAATEDGQEVTIRQPANEALQDVDARLTKAYQLLECLLS
jgi:hypothetical protein